MKGDETNAYVNRRERKENAVNDLYGVGERSREEAKNWRTARKMRETRGDFSDRTALENCGFELACTISRCLLHPSACDAKREEGVPRDRDNRGFKGEDCIQAHVERLTPVTSASFQPIAYPHSTDVTTSPVVTCIPRRKGGARVR